MSPPNDGSPAREEAEPLVESHKEGTWRSVLENNKGVLYILLSEAAGSSMDAIARFLQQGEIAFHPFQVRLNTCSFIQDTG